MKYFLTFIILYSLLISCNKNYVQHKKQWATVASTDSSKPVARHEAAFVKVNNRFYLLGGRKIKPVSIYDPRKKVWAKGAKPPVELHHFQPVVFKDDVYVICALTGKYPAETPLPHIYIYNTTSDSWRRGIQIPNERLRGSTGNVIKDGVVYISCGIKDGHRSDHKKWLDSYNIKTGEWDRLPNAPRARDHFQAVLADCKIYLLGGRRSKAPKKTFHETIGEVDVFDIKTKQWKTIANKLPTQRAGVMGLYYKKEILVIGGESMNQNPAHVEVEALNLKTLTWRTLPKLQNGRHGTGACIHDNKIYIASGSGNRGGKPELESMECY